MHRGGNENEGGHGETILRQFVATRPQLTVPSRIGYSTLMSGVASVVLESYQESLLAVHPVC